LTQDTSGILHAEEQEVNDFWNKTIQWKLDGSFNKLRGKKKPSTEMCGVHAEQLHTSEMKTEWLSRLAAVEATLHCKNVKQKLSLLEVEGSWKRELHEGLKVCGYGLNLSVNIQCFAHLTIW
jgi:hypothetical protein